MTNRTRIAWAVALAAGVLGALPAAQAQTPPSRTTASPSAPPVTRACRVKDHAGGTSCTANVPEAACTAIAREAKGTYTWTAAECP